VVVHDEVTRLAGLCLGELTADGVGPSEQSIKSGQPTKSRPNLYVEPQVLGSWAV